MRSRHFAIASLLVLGAFVAVACGDDDTSTDPAGDDDTPVDPAGDDDTPADPAGDDEASEDQSDDDGAAAMPAPSPGTGSLVIGDETYSFKVLSCELGEAETGEADVVFSLRGEGDDDLAVDVTRRVQPSADGDTDGETIDHVFLYEDVPVGQEYVWEAFSAPAGSGVATAGGFLEIDGDRVTGTAEFQDRLDEDFPPVVEAGTIEATCP